MYLEIALILLVIGKGDVHPNSYSVRRGDTFGLLHSARRVSFLQHHKWLFTFYRDVMGGMSATDTAFKLFDQDRDGYITRAEFAKVTLFWNQLES